MENLEEIIDGIIKICKNIPKIYDEINDKIFEEYINYKENRNIPDGEIIKVPYFRIEKVIDKLKEEAIKECKLTIKEYERIKQGE